MGTIAEKLQYTSNAVNDIQNALIEKGVSVEDADELSTYGDKVRSLANTSDGTATDDCIWNGYTAYAKGSKITGTLKPIGGSIVPATSHYYDGSTFYVGIPAGMYMLSRNRGADGGASGFSGPCTGQNISIKNSNIISKIGLTNDKIVKGETILGVTGTNDYALKPRHRLLRHRQTDRNEFRNGTYYVKLDYTNDAHTTFGILVYDDDDVLRSSANIHTGISTSGGAYGYYHASCGRDHFKITDNFGFALSVTYGSTGYNSALTISPFYINSDGQVTIGTKMTVGSTESSKTTYQYYMYSAIGTDMRFVFVIRKITNSTSVSQYSDTLLTFRPTTNSVVQTSTYSGSTGSATRSDVKRTLQSDSDYTITLNINGIHQYDNDYPHNFDCPKPDASYVTPYFYKAISSSKTYYHTYNDGYNLFDIYDNGITSNGNFSDYIPMFETSDYDYFLTLIDVSVLLHSGCYCPNGTLYQFFDGGSLNKSVLFFRKYSSKLHMHEESYALDSGGNDTSSYYDNSTDGLRYGRFDIKGEGGYHWINMLGDNYS